MTVPGVQGTQGNVRRLVIGQDGPQLPGLEGLDAHAASVRVRRRLDD